MIYDLSKMEENDVYAINLSCYHSYIYYHKTGKVINSIWRWTFVMGLVGAYH